MKALRLLIPVATLVAALVATSGLSLANKDMAKETGKKCNVCHSKGKDLNDVGKAYKAELDAKKKK
jgi:cytochrome c2